MRNLLLLALFLASCGTSVEGLDWEPADAVLVHDLLAEVRIMDDVLDCESEEATVPRRHLVLSLSTPEDIRPGSDPNWTGTLAGGTFSGADLQDATGGSVTVDAYDPGDNVSGSFDLDFGGRRVSGSFDARYCRCWLGQCD